MLHIKHLKERNKKRRGLTPCADPTAKATAITQILLETRAWGVSLQVAGDQVSAGRAASSRKPTQKEISLQNMRAYPTHQSCGGEVAAALSGCCARDSAAAAQQRGGAGPAPVTQPPSPFGLFTHARAQTAESKSCVGTAQRDLFKKILESLYLASYCGGTQEESIKSIREVLT
ncbi:hypothetical protein EYF80_056557 [Liparis tanakae]|uniref:Uncharacterized protein n=1 Tax=Liparis tanakae TaxID=230148 RepID=A0A4Z2EWJ3_9TELE|nr:hypothetical protein EYF80_056557 [Liparis tanakae]